MNWKPIYTFPTKGLEPGANRRLTGSCLPAFIWVISEAELDLGLILSSGTTTGTGILFFLKNQSWNFTGSFLGNPELDPL